MSEMAGEQIPSFFFDTNCLKRFGYKYLSVLLEAVRRGNIRLYVSEWTLYEISRQRLVYEKGNPGSMAMLLLDGDSNERELIHVYHLQRIEMFLNSGATVIPALDISDEEIDTILTDQNSYFEHSEAGNDSRDAAIYLSCMNHVPPEGLVVVCDDTNLIAAFKAQGHEVVRLQDDESVKGFCSSFGLSQRKCKLEEPSIRRIQLKLRQEGGYEQFESKVATYDKNAFETLILPHRDTAVTFGNRLDEEIRELAAEDSELRVSILGVVYLLGPIEKQHMVGLLENAGFDSELVGHNIERFLNRAAIQETENYYIPHDESICMEAANRLPEAFVETLMEEDQ